VSNSIELNYGGGILRLKRSADLAVRRSAFSEIFHDQFPATNTYRSMGGYGVFATDHLAEVEALRDDDRLVGAVASVYHTSVDKVPFIPTGSLYLKFKATAGSGVRNEVLSRHGLTLVRIDDKGAITATVPAGQDAVHVAIALQREPAIVVAEPDLATEGKLKGFALPNDAMLHRQWHLENRGSIAGSSEGLKAGADARVVAAWRAMQSFGMPSIAIAVIDDGFDLSHPDLAGRWRDAWDFETKSADVRPRADVWSQAGGNWHGTACAALAVGGVGAGDIIGVAPHCTWIPIRWSDLKPEEVEAWFDYAREKDAAVVSCSWGARDRNYPLCDRLSTAITRLATEGRGGRGTVIVFAAGNDGRDVNDPAHESVDGFVVHPHVIAVSASTSMDSRAAYSNFGKEIWLSAPSSGVKGRDVVTADATGEYIAKSGMTRPMGYAEGDYAEHFGKTSAACPIVAGVCALMLSVNPALSAKDVRAILRATARRTADAEHDAYGHSKYFGFGCVDAEAAVIRAQEALQIA
jgi:subtilisin family serine protease